MGGLVASGILEWLADCRGLLEAPRATTLLADDWPNTERERMPLIAGRIGKRA